MASALTSSRFAIAKYSHGLVLTVPKSVPVMPAMPLYSLKKFCSVMVAIVCVSCLIGTRSLASMA